MIALASTPTPVTAERVAAVIRAHRFRYTTEDELQQLLATAIANAGLPVEREVRLGDHGRIDLFVGGVGVEVKVAGALTRLRRQLERYARSQLVRELVVVSNRASHHQLPQTVLGKPLILVDVAEGSWL